MKWEQVHGWDRLVCQSRATGGRGSEQVHGWDPLVCQSRATGGRGSDFIRVQMGFDSVQDSVFLIFLSFLITYAGRRLFNLSMY